MHTIPKASDDKQILFNILCANINSDSSVGNCLASNYNSIVSLLYDNRNSSSLCGL